MEQGIKADVVGFTSPNYRMKKNQYKSSMFLPKPRNTGFGLTKDFTLQKSYKTVARYFDVKETKHDQRAFEIAFEMTKRHFLPFMEGSVVLSNEQAQEKTDMRTSAGVPFKFKGMTTKEQFYSSEMCATYCARDWDACLGRKYADTVVYDIIDKEEIRSEEKLAAGDIRSIACPPADHLHTGQRLFADMNRRITAAHLLCASAIGLSTTNGWWSQMVFKLAMHEMGFAGDESKWDASLKEILMNVARDLRICALPAEAERIRNYYTALVHTNFRMPDGTIIRKRQGNPSGSVNTSYDNTIILFFLMAYCWVVNVDDDYRHFMEIVAMVLYGDDNTFTVRRDYLGVYNLKTLAAAMADFGVKLKNPDDPPRHYSDLEFLSHKWKKVHGFWLPYMDSRKLKIGMYYSEYPGDAWMQALMIIEYLITNPFDDGFYEYCLAQLEYLYPHLIPADVQWLKNHIPTKDELFNLYTGAEGSLSTGEKPLPGRPQCKAKARVRNFKSTPHFEEKSSRRKGKRYTTGVTSSKVSDPTEPLVMSTSNEPIQLGDIPTPAVEDVKRGKKILNSPMLSNQARRWLTRAVDPFHDEMMEPAGYPDLMTIGTIVQEINLTTTVMAPPGVTGNWDCHIFNLAHFAAATGNIGDNCCVWSPSTGQVTTYGGSASYPNSGLNILSCETGGQLLPTQDSLPISTNLQTQNLTPLKYMMGRCRVVGMAFEVVNTTSELNLQGLVTAYRMPQQRQQSLFCGLSTSTAGVVSLDARIMTLFNSPPTSVSEALVLPSSKQWDAKRGAYVVCTQMGADNPITSVDTMSVFYSAGGFWNSVANPGLCGFGQFSQNISQGGSNNFTTKYYAPYNTSGVYFSGLSNPTTLQVNYKIILESIPNPRDIFATMAKPATPYSVEAIRLYGELIEHLPVGVPFDENPNGEWFSTVLGVLGEIASLGSLVNPMFGLVGQGFGLGKKVYDHISHAMDKKIKDKAPGNKIMILDRPRSEPKHKPDHKVKKDKGQHGGSKSKDKDHKAKHKK